MPACTSLRLDHQDLNVSTTPRLDAVYDPAADLVYIVYANDAVGQTGIFENNTLWYREMIPATLVLTTPFQIAYEADFGSPRLDRPRLTILSDGRLVLAFTTTNGVVVTLLV